MKSRYLVLCVPLLLAGCVNVAPTGDGATPGPSVAGPATPAPGASSARTLAPLATATAALTLAPIATPTQAPVTLPPQTQAPVTQAPVTLPPPATTPATLPPAGGHQDPFIADFGSSLYKGQYDDGTSITWGVLVTNPNTNEIAKDVEVQIDFTDASGGLVAHTDDTIAAILPTQTAAVGDSMNYFSNPNLDTVTNMKVQIFIDADTGWEDMTTAPGTFTFDSIKTTKNALDDLHTTALINSSFANDLESPKIVAIYRSGGDIVGGAYTYADTVPAGGSVGIEIYGPGAKGVDSTEMYGVLSYLSIL